MIKSRPTYSNLKNFIFDFDGVILDSLNCKTEAFYNMYLPYGIEIADKVKEYHLLNGGVSRYEKFKKWHKNFLNINLNNREIEKLSLKFSNLVFSNVIKSAPIPGAIEFIKKYSNDFNFFIISGTPDDEIKNICNRIRISNYFKEILGSPKDKKFWCNKLIINYGLNNNETLFLGDALSDYEAAKKSNFYFALRSANYNEEIFYNLNVDFKFKNFQSLLKTLKFPC